MHKQASFGKKQNRGSKHEKHMASIVGGWEGIGRRGMAGDQPIPKSSGSSDVTASCSTGKVEG
jgi:hypothetical protein